MTTPIPYHDFGGGGAILHFAHSNGFPPAVFRQMMEPLLPTYHVMGIYHRPLWPCSQMDQVKDWHAVADDMIRFFEQEDIDQVIGVGHSLGAVATMYAAVERPGLFCALVLIEPVFLLPDLLQLLAAAPDAMQHHPLVQNTRNRRRYWPDRQAAFDHFRVKEVFRHWSDTALWDYVTYALQETPMGLTLTYTPDWEAHFYSLPPTDVWDVIPQIRQPTLAIRGVESDTIFPEAWALWQRLQPQATFVEIPEAGHMVPMEQPLLVAGALLDFLGGR